MPCNNDIPYPLLHSTMGYDLGRWLVKKVDHGFRVPETVRGVIDYRASRKLALKAGVRAKLWRP